MARRYPWRDAGPAVQSELWREWAGDIQAAIDGNPGDGFAMLKDREFTEREMSFIGQRESFYLASVTDSGWPNVEQRTGAPGFIRAVDATTLIFQYLDGNKHAQTVVNIDFDDRVAMLFVDYAKSRRLTVTGRLAVARLEDAPYLAAELFQPASESEVGRVGSIRLEAFEWSRPRHVARRYTAAELAPLTRRVSALETENAILQAKIAVLTSRRT